MPAAIDWSALTAKLGNEPDFLRDLLGVVISTNESVPAALRDAARSADLPSLVRLAHRTKGMAGDIVARSCHELATRTEQAARAQDEAAAGLAVQLADTLESLLEEARAHLVTGGSPLAATKRSEG